MSQWIKCSERMPKDGDEVLLTGYSYGLPEGLRWMSVATFDQGNFYVVEANEADQLFDNFTHWMPLPNPPVQVKQKEKE